MATTPTTPNLSPPLTSRAKGYAPPKNMLPLKMNQICKEEP